MITGPKCPVWLYSGDWFNKTLSLCHYPHINWVTPAYCVSLRCHSPLVVFSYTERMLKQRETSAECRVEAPASSRAETSHKFYQPPSRQPRKRKREAWRKRLIIWRCGGRLRREMMEHKSRREWQQGGEMDIKAITQYTADGWELSFEGDHCTLVQPHLV